MVGGENWLDSLGEGYTGQSHRLTACVWDREDRENYEDDEPIRSGRIHKSYGFGGA